MKSVSLQHFYLILVFGLFVFPRALQRYGVPTAITSVLMGILAGPIFGWVQVDQIIEIFAITGIVTLFLLAGLEVDLDEIGSEKSIIVQHVVIGVLGIIGVSSVMNLAFDVSLRPSILVALAVVTPSAGFILDSLNQLGMEPREKFWIRSKAIASEIFALGMLLVVLQSQNFKLLSISLVTLLSMVFVLPFLFRIFAKWVVPHAPQSEFTFLVMMAMVFAYVTKTLGVYYLVGAFLVGLGGQRFRHALPSLASEKMLHAIETFSSFFIPFYFFYAGLNFKSSYFAWEPVLLGMGLCVVIIPLRAFAVSYHRKKMLGENLKKGFRVGMSMIPTLVFTLVIVEILNERYAISNAVAGGLLIYALINTVVPSMFYKVPPPDYEVPHIHDVEVPEDLDSKKFKPGP